MISSLTATSGHGVQKRGQPGSGLGRSHGSHSHHLGQLLQQLGQGAPQVSVVLLERLELILIQAAVGVHMERRLIEIVRAPPLEGHQLPHRGEVHLEHIAVEGHFPNIGAHVVNTCLLHTVLNRLQLLRAQPNIKRYIPAALLPCHAYRSPRSGASFLWKGGLCRSWASLPASFICWEMEGFFSSCSVARFRSMRRPTAGLSLEGRSS